MRRSPKSTKASSRSKGKSGTAAKSKATPAARAKSQPKPASSRRSQLAQRLAEALEQLAATREILRVISSSPTDTQPVFDAIAAAATTLCAAENAGVFLFDGTLIHFAAHYRWNAVDLEAINRTFPRP